MKKKIRHKINDPGKNKKGGDKKDEKDRDRKNKGDNNDKRKKVVTELVEEIMESKKFKLQIQNKEDKADDIDIGEPL